MTGLMLLIMKTSAPRVNIFYATQPLIPLTNVTTAITAATPITTPSRVSAERSLLAHRDCSEMRMASRKFMDVGRWTSDLGRKTSDLSLTLEQIANRQTSV